MKRRPIKDRGPKPQRRPLPKKQAKHEEKKQPQPQPHILGFARCNNHVGACVWTPSGCADISDDEILNQIDRFRGIPDIELAARRKARTAPLLPHVKCRLVRNLCLDRPKDISILTAPNVDASTFDSRPRNCRIMRQRIVRKLSTHTDPKTRIPLDLKTLTLTDSDGGSGSSEFVLQALHMEHIFRWVDTTYFNSTLRWYLSPYLWKVYTDEDSRTVATTELSRGTIIFRVNAHMSFNIALLGDGIWTDSLLEALVVTVEHEVIHAIMERKYQDAAGEEGVFEEHGTEFLCWARFLYGHSGLNYTAASKRQKKDFWQLSESEEEDDHEERVHDSEEQDDKKVRKKQDVVVKEEPLDHDAIVDFMAREDRVVRNIAERIDLLWYSSLGELRFPTSQTLEYLVKVICVEYDLDQKLSASYVLSYEITFEEKKTTPKKMTDQGDQQDQDNEEERSEEEEEDSYSNILTLEYEFKQAKTKGMKPVFHSCRILLDGFLIRQEVRRELYLTHGALLCRFLEFALVHIIMTIDQGPEFGHSSSDRKSLRMMCIRTFGLDRFLLRFLRLSTSSTATLV